MAKPHTKTSLDAVEADLFSDDPKKVYSYWSNEIAQAKKKRKAWWERCDKIIRQYRDERTKKLDDIVGGRYNLFWSNVETLAPSVYNQTPTPVAKRTFYDKDPAARLGATIIERNLINQVEKFDFDGLMDMVVRDRLLPGLGQAWVEYKPKFETVEDTSPIIPEGDLMAEGGTVNADAGPQTYERKVGECVEARYIHFKDYLEGEARFESEIPWKGKAEYMNKTDLEREFGEEIAKDIPMDYTAGARMDARGTSVSQEAGDSDRMACIWEIWCKVTKKVYVIAESGYLEPLREADDPLELEGFFPCPPALVATMTSDTRIPVPDFSLYQHQIHEINELSERIRVITAAIKVAGVYDGSSGADLKRLMSSRDNVMIKVDTFAAFAEKGGLKGVVQFFPVQEIANVLKILMDARDRIKSDIFELTGISDIRRGVSDPNETKGAQQMKGDYGDIRLSKTRKQVANFARDILRIMGQIIADKFDPETLWAGSGAQYIPEAVTQQADPMTGQVQMVPSPTFQAAIQLLQNDKERSFRVDIETDSTVAANSQADKQSAVEMTTAIAQFLTAIGPIIQEAPELKAPMAQLLLFNIRRFRAGSTLESVFEAAVDQASQPTPPKPNPAMIDAQTKQTQVQGTLAIEQQKMQGQQQLQGQKIQGELAVKQMQMRVDNNQAEADRQADISARRHEMALDLMTDMVGHAINHHSNQMGHAVAAAAPVGGSNA